MNDWAMALVGIIFASTGFWSLIILLVNRHYAKKDKAGEKETIVMESLLAILHYRVYRLCKIHLKNGYISEDELEALGILYEYYRKLGGNGTCKKLYERCCELPIKD